MKPKITFKQVSETRVDIFMNEKKIGDVWSYLSTGNDNESYSGDNSIQICGIKDISPMWGCGRYDSKKDVCVIFEEKENEEEKCCCECHNKN